ncbi:MAG TPA: hypothetical protein VHY81_00295 [Acidimicrobiales bacterium]|jgi:hypothetical protein|nr:hypothetical protein [Acidimicrobiales bacterium]
MASSSSGASADDERAEVLRLSAQQTGRFAVAGSPVLFEAPAFYPLIRMGVRPHPGSYEVACWLRITQDGMAMCTVSATGELVWSAHLDPPNQWKFSGPSFAFVRVGDHPYTTRHGAFAANLSAGVATPVVGFFKLFHGFRQRGALKRVLDARRPGGPAPATG